MGVSTKELKVSEYGHEDDRYDGKYALYFVSWGYRYTLEKNGKVATQPILSINAHWYPKSIWDRIRKAWRMIRYRGLDETPFAEMRDYREIEAPRDFLNRCLANTESEE